MGLLTILSTVGSAILSAVIPTLGDKLVEKVNEFVEPNKRLDPTKATGEEVSKAVQGLPPETQALIIESDVAKEIANLNFRKGIDDNTVKLQLAMIESEKNGSRTRPRVVAAMTVLVFIGLMVAIGSNGYIAYKAMSMFENKDNMVIAAAELTALKALIPDYTSWSIILGFPIWVIRSYFNDRTEDKRAMANAQVGAATEAKATFGGAVGNVITKKLFKM